MYNQYPLYSIKDRPLAEVLDAHLDRQDPAFLEDARLQIRANATPGLFDQDPRIGITIAVAGAEEDPEGVVRTLRQHDLQARQGTVPFFSILSINTPEGVGSDNANEIIEAIEAVRPTLHFPLSFFRISYPPEVKIGKIKKDPADATIDTFRQIYQGRYMPNILGLYFQDADLVRLSPSHITKQWTQLLMGAAVVQGSVRYARSKGRYNVFPDFAGSFPNMDEVMFVHDITSAFGSFLHDNQCLFDVRKYAVTNGISPKERQSEICNLILPARVLAPFFELAFEPHAFAALSPRRAYWGMQDGSPPTRMWDDRPFRVEDTYRRFDPSELRDISEAEAGRMISEMMDIVIDEEGKRSGRMVDMQNVLREQERQALIADFRRARILGGLAGVEALVARNTFKRFIRILQVHRQVFLEARRREAF